MSSVDPTQTVLEAAMRGAMARQSALTDNLVNATTPGYQRQDVDFQSQLKTAMQSGQPVSKLAFQTQTQAQVNDASGNGVDSDQESASLSENGLLYQALSSVLSAHDSILQYAMGTK